MSEMVERVTTALEPMCRGFGKGDLPMQIAREFARAAIAAMREPTQTMIDRGEASTMGCADLSWEPAAKLCWRAMIDAALATRQNDQAQTVLADPMSPEGAKEDNSK